MADKRMETRLRARVDKKRRNTRGPLLDIASPRRYSCVSIYSPRDLPQGLSRGYFLACGISRRGD